MYNSAIKILEKINNAGYKAYVIGGYARDLYLKRDSVDVDICTDATPKELKEIFGDIMLPNIQYGSITVIYNKIRFEITTFRKDLKYENNRLPVKIKYIHSLVDDLKRRDFTINTLCMDVNGELLDFLNAKPDLDNKIIRMVGNPKKKLKEDSLRILRAIRFATILNFTLDNELKKYIKKYNYLLRKLSYYRKKEELDKIFTSPNIMYGISLLKDLNLMEPLELKNIDTLVPTSSLIAIWAQLDVDSIYNFSNYEKDTILKIKELLNKNILDNKNLYYYGLYVSSLAGEIKGISKKDITEKYNNLSIKSSKDIVINGKEISEILKVKPGSYIKTIMKDLESNILDGKLNNDYNELREYIIENKNKFLD